MQTPKARTGSLEVPQRKSPTTLHTARQLKIPGSDSNVVSSSPHPTNRTPKDKSPKVIERKSPRSPATTEKKRPNRVSELESQLAQLQEELKKVKEQLSASDSWKKQAQQEAEEAKKQFSTMSAKLEESQQQLLEITTSEDARVEELRKISQDRDKAWQSELDALQKQHAMDSAALASAMNEIQRLKVQLEKLAESEVALTKHAESAHAEMQSLRIELTETLSLVGKLKSDLNICKESEAQAIEVVRKTQMQLERANANIEMLQSEGTKATEGFNSLSLELEQSKAQVKSFKELVSKLQADLLSSNSDKLVESLGDVDLSRKDGEKEEIDQLKVELNHSKFELSQLRSALEASETRYQEEYIKTTLRIRRAYEQVEHVKSESCQREAELETQLKNAKAHIEELRANLMDKETELQYISEENEGLNLKIKGNGPSEADLAELKVSMLDKETELHSLTEQNETLKLEIEKKEMERNKINDEAITLAEAARAAEQEALMKVGYLTEEADRSSRRAAHVTEQLDAAQVANTEMEAELRRLKVQLDQWRKAAEAATAMLSTGNNGKFVENKINYLNGTMGSPYLEDMDDDSPKKKNANMLKKIGVLWKKGQK
ncbi:interactor of constitutive active ROPs 2, chloroplastic-like isoform X2 [Mangifera indica]|uniref:interactor of constitutive active ROPs 2, chloroplastic-like isoform X2 n=1 Tax=Mangifera indica TaxID=29780 RepID=UPI001CFB44E4|nr:interactor of constitutive active ROPs 2, chloroplastic-like isoform X2 [Mangifera indica]